jgi:hypothetical protein
MRPANNRFRKDAGSAANGPAVLFGGPGGSSTPILVDLCGGPPLRAEDACGCSSSFHSWNSYGIKKCYRWLSMAFKLNAVDLEQAKDGFHSDPRGHGMLCSVACRDEFPSAHGFHRALIQAKADAFDDANVLRSAIRSHKHRQRH